MVSAYENARANNARYLESLRASNDRRTKRKAAEEEAKRKAELQAQQIAAQERRDKQQQKYGQADTAQRAYYAANEAADDFNRTKQLNRQQQKDVRRRDTLNNDFTLTRDREQARDQQDQDQLRFGFSTRENEQKFGYQTMENEQQFGHQMQRDRFQHGNTMERDGMQFGFDRMRAQQQHGNTMQRDSELNQFDTQSDVRQNEFQQQRDNRLNMFDVNRDARQQQYTQQNAYQRETAEVSARWQEQIQKAKNAGLDFSEKQKQEMKELDRSFRKNVLSADYDEGLKQRAMLLHQKNLAAIVPDQKVANPKEGLESALMFDERTKSWVLQGRDSQGFPTYEPWNSGNDSMENQQRFAQEKERQVAEKQTAQTRDASFERLDKWQKVLDKHQNRVNAEGEDFYPNPTAALESAMKEFAPQEDGYRQGYGLSPLYPYQNEVDAKRKELEDQQNRPRVNPWRTPNDPQQQRQHVPGMADSLRLRSGDEMPRQAPSNSPIAAEIETKMKAAADGNDRESAVALQTVKAIIEQFNGSPPAGSQEMSDFMFAYNLLKKKGIPIPAPNRRKAGPPPATILPSEHMMMPVR